MKIVIASDHGGIDMKDELVKRLKADKHEILDVGTYDTQSVDYPDYAAKAAEKVVNGEASHGILVCGTGIGMSIAANKIHGIFCAKINSAEEGILAAEHNNANMIALGGRTTDIEEAWKAVLNWLRTPFGGDRHARRTNKIVEMDKD